MPNNTLTLKFQPFNPLPLFVVKTSAVARSINISPLLLLEAMSEEGGDSYDDLFDEFDDGFDTQEHNPAVAHRLLEEMPEEPAPATPQSEIGEKRPRAEGSIGSSVGFALPPGSGSNSQPGDACRGAAAMPYAFSNFEDLWTQASEAVEADSAPKAVTSSTAVDDLAFGDFDDWEAPQTATTAAPSAPASAMLPPAPVTTFLDKFKKWFPRANLKMATPSVVNVVSVMYLGFGVDLRVLCCSLRNIEYTNKSTPKAILKLMEPKCVAIIRNSGSVMLLGSVSVSAARAAAELVARLVRVTLRLTAMHAVKFRVRCIMARFDLQHPVRLDELALNNPAVASYEPESFCGCIVTVRGSLPPATVAQGSVVALSSGDTRTYGSQFLVSCSVYTSGKVTMTGAHSVRELEAAYKLLIPVIAPHARR
jgi:transcription initiation factor TFIID TATA-box-binding protein